MTPRLHACLIVLSPGLAWADPLSPALGEAGLDYLRATAPAIPAALAQDSEARRDLVSAATGKAAQRTWQTIADAGQADARLWFAPGLLADRERREVWLWGWGSGMEAGQPVEFFLIHQTSGHGYETIAICPARPSDIHRALVFAGFAPGWPADPSRQRLWPKGDRLRISVHTWEGDSGAAAARPVEDFVAQSGTGQRLPATNHVFVGSARIPDPQKPDTLVYAADLYSPSAIAANYNLEATVLDLPRQARKEAVYGSMLAAEAPALREGQPVLVRLSAHPDFPAGSIPQHALAVRLADGKPAFSLAGTDKAEILRAPEAGPVLAKLAEIRKTVPDLFVALDLAGELTTGQIRPFAHALMDLDTTNGVKVDPPGPGQLYYRAYTPREEFRDRQARPFQPWELHLRKPASGSWSGTLVILEEKWPEGKTEPELAETRLPADEPAVVARATEGRDYLPGVFFLMAPDDLPHAEAARWTEPIRSKFPVIYIFGEK